MIIAVVGTGTGVGKTHVATALLTALRARGQAAVGWKPVESGVTGAQGEDERLLALATGEVTPTLRLRAALAPNLAARLAGVTLDSRALATMLGELSARWPCLLLELAGGLFSPLDDELDNAEWLAALPSALRGELRLVLVAPDRLGVLHDVSAACRAAAGLGLAPATIVLSAISHERAGAEVPDPEAPDPEAPGGVEAPGRVEASGRVNARTRDVSVGHNEQELARRALTRAIPVVKVGHATAEELAQSPALQALVTLLLDG
ncbi:MAG: dethiobiotin synthase [Myxococcales bacterium]|nr:dethiobiotin synthase [Myxococcales bacterium]